MLSNLPGWRTNRHILVFESDDWGSIRMPSKETFNSLVDKGLPLSLGDSGPYNLFDTVANPEDLSGLFEVLSNVKDHHGNHCAFTAISVVANPDFERIKNGDFENYYYEPFTVTLRRYYGNNDSFELWKEGIRNRIFVPQFHGREHLNVSEWMRALKRGDRETHLAFEHGMWGFPNKPYNGSSVSYQAAFDFYDPEDLAVHDKIIADGLNLFESIFGYRAVFFVPPNGYLHDSLYKAASENGIRYLFASRFHSTPAGYGKINKSIHFIGQRNKLGQWFIIRNCFFEPCMKGKDWVNSCLNDIDMAFRWNKPAIISSHRVNYIGALDPGNRENGLSQLKQLLKEVVSRWPDVEFMTSAELGDLIQKSN